ncbi:hypothetical protein KIW84_035041 [Lathyrus oleraceus]|uniref:Uncharacterized protein n=1 Tax=Pisum sativum TaxID=3888 RepID=A0A9D5B628_PEA|nr:hypothetical protein KIW84_035041 [Pisum sativum]
MVVYGWPVIWSGISQQRFVEVEMVFSWRFRAITNHPRIIEETKSIDKVEMTLGLFLDSVTTDFSNWNVIDKKVEDNLKKDDKQKTKIIQKNKDQEGRQPHNDPIPMSYAQLLLILVNVGAIMPKQIEPAKFPYRRKHDPHSTCGYHAGYVGNSTGACHVLKTKVQELID